MTFKKSVKTILFPFLVIKYAALVLFNPKKLNDMDESDYMKVCKHYKVDKYQKK